MNPHIKQIQYQNESVRELTTPEACDEMLTILEGRLEAGKIKPDEFLEIVKALSTLKERAELPEDTKRVISVFGGSVVPWEHPQTQEEIPV